MAIWVKKVKCVYIECRAGDGLGVGWGQWQHVRFSGQSMSKVWRSEPAYLLLGSHKQILSPGRDLRASSRDKELGLPSRGLIVESLRAML